jgi:hypothetical protein
MKLSAQRRVNPHQIEHFYSKNKDGSLNLTAHSTIEKVGMREKCILMA